MYHIIGADQREYGPSTAEDIRQWILGRRADGRTKARLADATEWKTLAEFPEFADALANAPAPGSPPGQPAIAASPSSGRFIPLRPQVSIGDCFSRGWELLKANFWMLTGASALYVLIVIGIVSVPVVGSVAAFLMFGPLIGGWQWMFLKRLRGETVSLPDMFAGFGPCLLQLFLVGLVYQLLGIVGLILCILPGIYLFVVWGFCLLLVIDRKMEFWPAMELSRVVVHEQWWTLFGLSLLSILLLLVGVVALFVGLFVAAALVNAAFVCAYEELFDESEPAGQAL